MVPLYVACIVGGHGDVQAAPVLLKRLVRFVNPDVYAEVRHPLRVSRSRLVLPGELERAVELAGRGLRSFGVVLILVDSDDDCPKELAPALLERARQVARDRWRVSVILAKSEFETWFIAAAESIAGHAGLPAGLRPPADPESATLKGGCKKLCRRVGGIRRPSTNYRWRARWTSAPPGERRHSIRCVAKSSDCCLKRQFNLQLVNAARRLLIVFRDQRVAG